MEKRAKSRALSVNLAVLKTQQPPPWMSGSDSERSQGTPSSQSSGGEASPKSASRVVYTPYGDGDLYNDFAAGFQLGALSFCFLCNGPSAELVRSVERTNYRMTEGRMTDIFRPVYSCQACAQTTTERRRQDAGHRVRLVEGALAYYATHQ